METRGLNAYAAGLSPASATVAVTRGLLDTLEPDELRAVLAHEMTHIKNRDVQLMVVALIFAGGLTFLGNSLRSVTSFGRGPNGDNLMVPRHIFDSSEPDGEDIKELSAGALAVLVGITVAVATLALTHVFALLTQFAVSRAREFLADAGAVELTKDPDALISALQKVAGHDFVPVIAENFRAMMISNQFDEDNFMDKLFATHPSLGDRITSLQQYAGGRIVAKRRRAARGGFGPAQPANGGAGNAAAFAGGRASFGRRRAIGA